MASIRRHLASLGLAVVFCHLVMQILVPAALCCQKPAVGTTRAEAHECCPAGSHPGKVCPMRGSRANREKPGASDCTAQPLVDLHDIFMTLSSGGVVPTLVEIARPVGSEPALAPSQAVAPLVSHVPLGPPPRA